MNSPSKLSFIIAFLLYGLFIAVGYWIWTEEPFKPQTKPALTKVPVNLAMFAEPVVQEKPPIEQPTPKVEPVVEEKPIEEKVIEKPVVKKVKPEVKPKPVPKPKPIKKPVKKEIKKPIKKPIEKPPVKKVVKPVEQVKPSPKPIVTSKEPVKNVPKVEPKKQSAPSYSKQQTADAEQIYLSALRQKIVQYAHDTYPRRAKRRHWEGDVTIEFNLMPNGRITGLKIVNSSGRTILDQAALEIFQVKMANKFKPFPKEVNRKVWQIKVPVSYNLR
ncbi:hypothetical protein JCM30760_07320 [Thiomicrorhabdus hydrogeniphila]